MITYILQLLVKSPLYPHWLSGKKMQENIDYITRGLNGTILEVGAGDGAKKEAFMKKHKRIKKYIVTDYSSWDTEFDKFDPKKNKFGKYTQPIFGFNKRVPLDKVCDAMNLPFKKNSFDYHMSFSVLEHIRDPYVYFKEAVKVVKPKKYIIVNVPYMYRMHGGEPDHKMDFFRYSYGFFYDIAVRNNLKIVKIYSNSGFGTTLASLTNQWLIRRIMEGNIVEKAFYLLICPFIFLFVNVVGYLIDLKPDKRFATDFSIKLQKIA